MYAFAVISALAATALAAPAALVTRGSYVSYNGDGSTGQGWPSTDKWVKDFETMWGQNTNLFQSSCAAYGAANNSPQEMSDLKDAIQTISKSSGVDPRVILAIVAQESHGCVRVFTTKYSIANPGLMQDYQGSHTCNTGIGAEGKLTTPGVVSNPCPQAQIVGMIQDGTIGDGVNPNLKTLIGSAKDAQTVYVAARKYNAGLNSYDGKDLGAPGATQAYCSDVANRLTGVVFDTSAWVHGAAGTGPASAPAAPASPAAPAPAAPAAPASGSCKTKHTVTGGDTCWAIAQAAGIDTGKLASLNPGLSCQTLQIGASVCTA